MWVHVHIRFNELMKISQSSVKKKKNNDKFREFIINYIDLKKMNKSMHTNVN